MNDRYSIPGNEGESEPGSNGHVLRNLKAITTAEAMDEEESLALVVATNRLLDGLDRNHQFTADDIRFIHRVWLEGIYSWAGEYRTVNLSRDNFPFASAGLIPQLMATYENGPLTQYTPCVFKDPTQLAHALAVTHCELVLIHPFREGNGRCARLLAILMAIQAGLPVLDFEPIETNTDAYIAAIHASLNGNYALMAATFQDVIARTIDLADEGD